MPPPPPFLLPFFVFFSFFFPLRHLAEEKHQMALRLGPYSHRPSQPMGLPAWEGEESMTLHLPHFSLSFPPLFPVGSLLLSLSSTVSLTHSLPLTRLFLSACSSDQLLFPPPPQALLCLLRLRPEDMASCPVHSRQQQSPPTRSKNHGTSLSLSLSTKNCALCHLTRHEGKCALSLYTNYDNVCMSISSPG